MYECILLCDGKISVRRDGNELYILSADVSTVIDDDGDEHYSQAVALDLERMLNEVTR